MGNLKTRNSRNWFRYETLLPFELEVIRHEEREAQSFYADCFYICPKPRAASHLQTTGLASAGPESQPSRSDAGTQLTAFSQIPKTLSPRFRCMTSFTLLWSHFLSGVLFWHLWMMYLPRGRVSTCARLQLTIPCTEPKGSHPNKIERQDIQNEIPPQVYYKIKLFNHSLYFTPFNCVQTINSNTWNLLLCANKWALVRLKIFLTNY